jgi:hypothetical protein
MKTLSVLHEKPIEARRSVRARVQLRVWHVLVGAVLVSLVGWAALFLLIDLAASALIGIKV